MIVQKNHALFGVVTAVVVVFCGLSASRADNPQDVNALIRQLETSNRSERVEAARALGDIGDERAVEPLIRALGDKRAEVRWEAASALDRLTFVGNLYGKFLEEA